MKRQLVKIEKSAALIVLQIIVFSFLLVFTSQSISAQTTTAQTTDIKTDEQPVIIGKDVADLGIDGWLTVKNYQRGDKIETFSVDVTDALLSISNDSVSSSAIEVEKMVGIRESIVIFLKNGGVVAVRRNGRGTNCAGFKTKGLTTTCSLEKSSSADLWNIFVNGNNEYSVKVSGRPMDQVLVKTPRT